MTLARNRFLDTNPHIIEAKNSIILDDNSSNDVRQLRREALEEITDLLIYYKNRCYSPSLIDKIAEKKCEMILKSTTKEEMDKIVHPHNPHFEGDKYVPNEYSIPEEDLIILGEACIKASHNSNCQEKFLKLFREVFPEK